MNNPYSGFGQIVVGPRLVGREREDAWLFDRLGSTQGSVSIVGQPRIGKSSLAWAVGRRVVAEHKNIGLVGIDASTLPDSAALFRALFDEACEAAGLDPTIEESGTQGDRDDAYAAFVRCRRGLKRLHGRGLRTLLILDEFDAIRLLEGPGTTIQRMRDLVYQPHLTGLSAIFVSRRSLRAIELDVADISNLDGVCEQHFLGPLEAPGIRAMMTRSGEAWSLTAEDEALLESFTGGHPFLAEMVLCKGWDRRSLQGGVDECLASLFDFYENMRELLTADDLFDQLVQVTVGPRWSVKQGAIERLLRYGIMRRVERGDGFVFHGWSEHFQLYLQKCSREAALWDLWRQTEGGLRSFIDRVTSAALGDSWLSILSKRHAPIAKMVEGCAERQAREEKNFRLAAAGGILEYSYPLDLWQLIAAEWELFRDAFAPHDKRYWAERFQLLAKVRTPTAHNREHVVPEHEMTLAQGYCQELLAKLRSPGRVPVTAT